MKNAKKIIILVVAIALLAVLLIPSINPLLDEGTKNATTNQIQNTFGGLFGGSGSLTVPNLICTIAAALLVWLACTLVCWVLSYFGKKNGRSRSVVGLFSSLIKFCGFMAAVVWALSILGVNLTGIFIIFEGNYQVGDVIVLDDFRGTVRHIGLRTTTIEDGGGNLKIVNNSDIRNLQNRSRNNSIAVCDLSISYDASIEEVEKVMKKTFPEMYERNKDIFLGAPRLAGVESLGESSVVMRIIVDIKEENFFIGYRTLNREVKLMCDRNGIEIPFNQIVVHQAK